MIEPVNVVEKPAITMVKSSDSMWIFWLSRLSSLRSWAYELTESCRLGRRGSSTESLEYDGLFDLNDDLTDPFVGPMSPTAKSSTSLSASTTSSSGHSTKSSSSRKYVKLTVESFRLRRWEKDTTLDGMLSDMGPSKTYSRLVMSDTSRNIPAGNKRTS
jgi:hypothetical protein